MTWACASPTPQEPGAREGASEAVARKRTVFDRCTHPRDAGLAADHVLPRGTDRWGALTARMYTGAAGRPHQTHSSAAC